MLWLSLAILMCNACSSDVENPITSLDPIEMIVDKNWTMTAMSVSPAMDDGGNMITDVYAMMDACEQDDTFLFQMDGTMLRHPGAKLCTPDQDVTTERWTIDEDGQKIMLINDAQRTEMQLIQLSTAMMQMEFENPNHEGHLFVATYEIK